MGQLEAALFVIDEGGIRLVGRTMDPEVVSAARDVIARSHANRAAEVERLQSLSALHLVTDSKPKDGVE